MSLKSLEKLTGKTTKELQEMPVTSLWELVEKLTGKPVRLKWYRPKLETRKELEEEMDRLLGKKTVGTPYSDRMGIPMGPLEEEEHRVANGLFKDMQDCVKNGLEYARECLSEHDARLGRSSLKNKAWAEVMEKDIAKFEQVLAQLKEKYNV
jgi:hypothetical protein